MDKDDKVLAIKEFYKSIIRINYIFLNVFSNFKPTGSTICNVSGTNTIGSSIWNSSFVHATNIPKNINPIITFFIFIFSLLNVEFYFCTIGFNTFFYTETN